MAIQLGPLESQLIAYAQGLRRNTVASGQMVRGLGWTADQERKVLSRLARKGLIARVRPGLYLVSPRLPPGGRWSPGEFLALSTLIEDRAGRYQISGPNAFYRYGWTEQVPNRLYAYNNRISGERKVGAVALTLIKVSDERLGGVEEVRTPEGLTVFYASRTRALVDAVYDWTRFGTLPKAFDWIRQEAEKDDAFVSQFVRTTAEFGNQGTVRRVGVLLERMGVQKALLRRLEAKLRPSSSFIPWIPGRAKRGQVNKRWGVVINDG